MGDRPTMRSIAERAGVNVSTVSRVLRQRPSKNDTEIAIRVRQLADEAGYSPDLWAASLRSRQTRTVGVIVPHLTDVVMASVYEAIQENAAIHGYVTFSSSSRDDPAQQRRQVEQYLARRVDGLLIGDAHLAAPYLDELTAADVPFVLFNRHSGEHPAVTWDDELGGQLVAEHLLGTGHSRLAVVAGPRYASSGRDRVRGFVRACRAAGVDVRQSMIVESKFDVEGGRQAAQRLFRGSTRPTAIFAVNDYAAIGVMGVIRAAGLRVGTDVAVAGYNDITIAGDLLVPLTSVRVPISDMGRVAFEMLMARIDGTVPPQSRQLKPMLVPRSSTTGA